MILPDMSEVATAEQAREIAIEWQHRSAERDHSWSEVIDDANWFEALAQKFPELSDEFAENGIISAVPCLGCGSTEMPLHVDRMCPNCHDLDVDVDDLGPDFGTYSTEGPT